LGSAHLGLLLLADLCVLFFVVPFSVAVALGFGLGLGLFRFENARVYVVVTLLTIIAEDGLALATLAEGFGPQAAILAAQYALASVIVWLNRERLWKWFSANDKPISDNARV
jgi:hypothetical protein